MSHFTVLVIGEDIEAILQPYHEYECTGIEDQYVKFVPAEESIEELQKEFEEQKDGGMQSLHEYIIDYYGYHTNEAGVWGRRTNPDRKWDWWQVGGRWSNWILLKDGRKVDRCYKSDIDFEAKEAKCMNEAAIEYDKAMDIIDGTEPNKSWVEIRDSNHGVSIDIKREMYHAQARVIKWKENVKDPFSSVDDYLKSKDDFIEEAKLRAWSTYAICSKDGWLGKGDMGWWGISSNEDADWTKKSVEYIKSLPDDTIITLVDCHI